ncbi:MAG TPA: hypothetical protein VGI15_07155 [Candidatus Cybelea sp.]
MNVYTYPGGTPTGKQFWIAGASLIGPNEGNGGTVGYWRYPAGGNPSKTIDGLTYPFGVTVSTAK